MAEQVIIDYKVEIGALKARMKEVERSFKGAETAAKKAASEGGKAFDETGKRVGALGAITGNLKTQFSQLGSTIVAAFAVQQIIAFAGASIKAFQEAELNAKLLKSAVVDIGNEGVVAFQNLITQSEKLQKISIFSDDDIQKAQTQLIQFGLTSAEVEKLIPKILDLASAKSLPLAQATDIVTQGLNGLERGLKQNGIRVDLTGDSVQNYNNLLVALSKLEGQTQIVLDTSAGKWVNLKNKTDDAMEVIGEGLVVYADLVLKYNPITQAGKFFAWAFGKTTEAVKVNTEATKENNKVKEDAVKNIAFYEAAIAKIDMRLKSETISIKDTAIALKEKFKLQESLDRLQGKETEGEKAAKIAREKTIADNKAIADKILADQQAAGDKLFKQGDDLKKAANLALAKTEDERLLIVRDGHLKELEMLFEMTSKGEKETEAYQKARTAIYLASNLDRSKNNEKEAANTLNANKAIEDEWQEIMADFKKQDADEDATAKASQAKADDDAADQKQQKIAASFAAAGALLDAASQMNQNALNTDLQNLQAKLDAGLISEEEFDQQSRALKRAAAEDAKAFAIFNVILSTAQAVMAAWQTPYIGAILAGLALVAGLAQLAVVVTQPIPEFAKGTEYLTGANDAIPITAHRGEAIIPAKENSQHPGLAAAWIGGNIDKYIMQNYVLPEIQKQMMSAKTNENDAFIDKLAKSIVLNQKGFYDGNLLESDKKSRTLLKDQSEVLRQISRNTSSSGKSIMRKRGFNV